MGGASSEKNISIKTANAIIEALSRKHKDIIPISMSFNDLSFINQIQNGNKVKNFH